MNSLSSRKEDFLKTGPIIVDLCPADTQLATNRLGGDYSREVLVLYLKRPPRNSRQSHDPWPGASDTAT
jgi:hypothetical protein